MKIVPLRPEHLESLHLQQAQAHFGTEVSKPEYARAIQQSGACFTALDGDTVIACSGCFEVWPGRAMAWALIGAGSGARMVSLHRAVAGFLAQAKWRRIEAVVDAGFEPGHRWMRMLGFQLETPEPMRAYTPAGADCFLYARVK